MNNIYNWYMPPFSLADRIQFRLFRKRLSTKFTKVQKPHIYDRRLDMSDNWRVDFNRGIDLMRGHMSRPNYWRLRNEQNPKRYKGSRY